MGRFLFAVAALCASLALSGCRACDESTVCDSFADAADGRANDCSASIAFSCPYDPMALGPGSGTVCDLAWQCIDRLDGNTVECDGLDGLSIASCNAYPAAP